MHMRPVIGHEVAKLRFICTYPEIQAVVFITNLLKLKREIKQNFIYNFKNSVNINNRKIVK